MFGLGAGELFLIFMIAMMFFGPKKLPELAKGVGQALREFQRAKAQPDVVEVVTNEEKKVS
ncbi:MAG: twin-arginine translocase TatA/TatE family subunit [Bdellovibrionales bacterium]|nr:twin-arginine translocase TatA/TatE family subunit [Bdellovibrionales bacterium]